MTYLRTRLEHEKRQNIALNNQYQHTKREVEKLSGKLAKAQKNTQGGSSIIIRRGRVYGQAETLA